jgi:hypothetical protein
MDLCPFDIQKQGKCEVLGIVGFYERNRKWRKMGVKWMAAVAWRQCGGDGRGWVAVDW